jgi:hypothetical protein
MSGMPKREEVAMLLQDVRHPAVQKLRRSLPPNPAAWSFADVLIELLEALKPYQFEERP